ncbi:MAG TPA: hypothetical protein VFT09_05080 [Ilumatobacteraceae bacterium]|nr:hypothetical protein [Ilumatobacteraceae bacterium]
MTAIATPPAADEAPPRPSPWRYVLLGIVVVFAAFWIWALFFASKESINGIGEDDWSDRAQAICEAADAQRQDLADFREVADDDPAMVAERGDIVDRATDILDQMLDDIVAVRPTGAKGVELVPLWEADYRTYLGDRRAFSEGLRAGVNDPFAETTVDGIPISDKIARFAADNHMPACSPPTDLG